MARKTCADPENHKAWIRALLVEYYDPMYDYQLGKKTERVIFRGEQKHVLDYMKREHDIR